MPSLIFALALAAWSGAAAEAQAQPPAEAGAPEPAVARLNHAGYARKRHCTAVAVAPGEALTAAHCLDGVAPSEVHLLFGYSRMEWQAEGRIAAVRPLGGDLAALCLEGAAPGALAIGPPARPGDRVRLIGYGRPRIHMQHPRECTVEGRRADGAMRIDCPASEGDSGGPVLDAAGRVVGILSRGGSRLALAVGIPAGAASACAR